MPDGRNTFVVTATAILAIDSALVRARACTRELCLEFAALATQVQKPPTFVIQHFLAASEKFRLSRFGCESASTGSKRRTRALQHVAKLN